MASNTASYSFLLPTVGGDTNAWGGFLISNWEDMDDLLDGTTPVDGIDIDGGSIDGVVIGAATPAAASFTTVDLTGDLGIGTASPANDLHIAAAGTTVIRMQDTGGGYAQIVNPGSGNLSFRADQGNAVATSVITFLIDSSEVARFTAAGYFGIGITSPDEDLHIASSDPAIKLEDSDTNTNALINSNNAGSLRLRADVGDIAASSEITLEVDDATILDLNSSGMLIGTSGARVTTILDEDNFASDSDTALVTQQAIKAYVDSQTVDTFTSSAQTITSGGLVTVAHSLGVTPAIVFFRLVCNDAGGDAGYSQNDEILIPATSSVDAAITKANTVYVDSTNVNVRFSASATCFTVGNKSSGTGVALSNSKWDLYIEARV